MQLTTWNAWLWIPLSFCWLLTNLTTHILMQNRYLMWCVFQITNFILTIIFHEKVTAFSALMLLVGQQEEHPVRKKLEWWSAGAWHGYLSWARCKWLTYCPVDATSTPSSLLQKIQNGLSFWYRPTQVVLERPLNNCCCCFQENLGSLVFFLHISEEKLWV